MKKLLLLIMITLTPTYIYALGQEIHNLKYERSYYTAKKKAIAEDKVLLVMMAIQGCPNCAYMKDIVFERENILNYLNENFVVLIFDINRDKHIYPKRFKTHRGPTFFFIDPKDEHELREKKVGGALPKKFIKILQEVRATYDGVPYISPEKVLEKKLSDTNTTKTVKTTDDASIKSSFIRLQ